MSTITLKTGRTICTDGPLRVIMLHGEWYLIGDGSMVHVKTQLEGRNLMRQLMNYPEQILALSEPDNLHNYGSN